MLSFKADGIFGVIKNILLAGFLQMLEIKNIFTYYY
jgi:hypothetical protein